MAEVTRVSDSSADIAMIDLDDFSGKLLYSGIAGKREEAPTEAYPTHQFELSREELARDYRRLSIG
jgi:hypothetical protein